MRHTLLALIIIMLPMTAAGWLSWVLLEDRGMALVFGLLVGVTFGPPLARLAQGADPASARTRS